MKKEDIILLIIRQTGLSQKEINEMIEKKREKLKIPIHDLFLLLQIVQDLCVEL